MVDVGHQLTIALVSVMLGLQASACSNADVVLGARGAPTAGAGAAMPASGNGAEPGGSAGAAGVVASDADAPADAESDAGGGLVAAPRPSAGCGNEPALQDDSIEVNGVSASYILDLPAPYDNARAYPLLMAFRRSNTTAEAFREALNLPAAVGAEAILVHANPPNDASSWQVPGDLDLVEVLLPRLTSSYCVDEGRVFAVGLGQGALLVNALGCARDTLRGLAPLSAVIAPPEVCGGQAAVWLMQASEDLASAQYGSENRDFWIERNGCEATAATAIAPSPCVAYAGCDARFPVRFCEYGPELDLPSFTASALWDFFSSL